MVLGELPRHPGHVARFPGEHIPVCPQEVDERAFLCGVEASADQDLLGGVALHQVDALGVLGGLEARRRGVGLERRALEDGVVVGVDLQRQLGNLVGGFCGDARFGFLRRNRFLLFTVLLDRKSVV